MVRLERQVDRLLAVFDDIDDGTGLAKERRDQPPVVGSVIGKQEPARDLILIGRGTPLAERPFAVVDARGCRVATRTVNVLPTPGTLSGAMSPPSLRASSRLIASPKPVPPYCRAVQASDC